MNREEFIDKVRELAHTRKKAIEYNDKQRRIAEESYIAENCPFKEGDKVVVPPNRQGTIERINADEFGDFSFDVRFLKKDGTPSLLTRTVYCKGDLKKA